MAEVHSGDCREKSTLPSRESNSPCSLAGAPGSFAGTTKKESKVSPPRITCCQLCGRCGLRLGRSIDDWELKFGHHFCNSNTSLFTALFILTENVEAHGILQGIRPKQNRIFLCKISLAKRVFLMRPSLDCAMEEVLETTSFRLLPVLPAETSGQPASVWFEPVIGSGPEVASESDGSWNREIFVVDDYPGLAEAAKIVLEADGYR